MAPARVLRPTALRRAVATLTCAVLALAALPSGPASAEPAPVSISFDTVAAGQSAATAYPQVVVNPSPTTNNLSSGCTPTVVADASPSSPPNAVVPMCPSGEFDVPGSLLGVLTSGSTASVSLRFGGYGLPLASTPFVLEAFDSGNELVASVGASGAPGSLTVTVPQPTITSFRVRPTNGGIGFRFWVDDITWTPASVPLPPDFQLARQPGGSLGLLEGATSDPQPLTVTPVNGSAGQVTWSVAGLPAGVTAAVTPTPGGGDLVFTAAEGTNGAAGTVTVTATPVDAATGTTPHSVTFDVSVSSPLVLSAGAINAPVCGPVPITAVAWGPAAPGRLTIALTKPVPGLSVSLQTTWRDGTVTESPSASSPFVTGTNVYSTAFALLVRVNAAKLPTATAKTGLTLTLTGGGRTLTRTVGVRVRRPVLAATPTTVRPVRDAATVADASTPPFDQLTVSVKAPVRLCPGTLVKVGAGAWRATDLAVDGSFVRLAVPRDATSGRVQVRSAGFGTMSAGPVTVRTFRSTSGFAFGNYRPGFDLGDMWEAFGWDVFVKVLGVIPTPIPSPEAVILLGVANSVFDGACFGISRASNEVRNPARLKLFAPPGAPDAWHLTGPAGPSESLRHRIAALHLTQLSTQFLRNFLAARSTTAAMSPDQLRQAIASARRTTDVPYLMLEDGTDSAKKHVVLVYDVRSTGAGGVDIDVYDSNVPFTAAEQAPTPKAQLVHANALERSTVHVAANGDWSLSGTGLSNTGMRGMALMTAGSIPAQASMIKVSTPMELTQSVAAVFGLRGTPGGGAAPARITEVSSGSRRFVPGAGASAVPTEQALPVAGLLDAGRSAAAGEGWAVDTSGGPVRVTVAGTGSGSYRQLMVADGYAGSATLPSASGRAATMTFDPAAGSVAVAHEAVGGSVAVEAAGPDGSGGTRTAALRLSGSAAGTDAVAVTPTGDVVVQRSGPPVAATLTLSSGRGGSSRSATARVSLATGTTTVTTPDWDRLQGAVTVAGPEGTTTATLRPASAPSVRAAGLSIRSAGRTRVATVRVVGRGTGRLDRLSVAWTAVRGSTVLARAITPVAARGGARATWRLPASARGARIVAVPVVTRTQGLTVTTVTGRPAAGR